MLKYWNTYRKIYIYSDNSYLKIINLAEISYRNNGHFAENTYRIGFISEYAASKKPVFVCLHRQKLISSATHF